MPAVRNPLKRQACKAPVYPEHQDHDHPGFFLACLLREQAQYDEIKELTNAANFWRKPAAYQDAIYSSMARLSAQIDKSLPFVVDDGLLPYAHVETTVFATGAAVTQLQTSLEPLQGLAALLVPLGLHRSQVPQFQAWLTAKLPLVDQAS